MIFLSDLLDLIIQHGSYNKKKTKKAIKFGVHLKELHSLDMIKGRAFNQKSHHD